MIQEANIIRSRRRSISIEIGSGGELIVRAPYYVSRSQIDAFIAEKQTWIAAHQERGRAQAGRAEAVSAAEGSRLPFMGAMISLSYHDKSKIELSSKDPADLSFWDRAMGFPTGLAEYDGATLLLPAPRLRGSGISIGELDPAVILKQNQELLIYWYKQQAKNILKWRTSFYAAQMGLRVSRVRISSARSNWGSCNAKGGINYSHFLMCMHPRAIDYVVVHELSHIRHRDHSAAFYAEVEKTLPDYREREKELKDGQWVLQMFN